MSRPMTNKDIISWERRPRNEWQWETHHFVRRANSTFHVSNASALFENDTERYL